MKILFFPYQPHCFAFGGFELQMLSAYDALNKNGIDVHKIDLWDRDNNFDIAHIWGVGLANYENFFWAKKSGKKIVTTILPDYFEDFKSKVKFHLSLKLYKQRFFKEMMHLSDAIVVVNQQQADVCINFYKVNKNLVHVIPNIVNDVFFESAFQSQKNIGNEGYILSVGNICRRKNQINLAKATIAINHKLVLIGKVLDGEELYGNELDKIVKTNSNIKWIKGLDENSKELVEYYKNSISFALPSFKEQQPISLLEAVTMGKPILVGKKAYSKQKYFENCYVVNPNSISDISKGLKSIINQPHKFIPSFQYMNECRANNVAEKYINVYRSLLQ